jgi:hypothetical protein
VVSLAVSLAVLEDAVAVGIIGTVSVIVVTTVVDSDSDVDVDIRSVDDGGIDVNVDVDEGFVCSGNIDEFAFDLVDI